MNFSIRNAAAVVLIATVFITLPEHSAQASRNKSTGASSWWDVVDTFVERLESRRLTPTEKDARHKAFVKHLVEEKAKHRVRIAKRQHAINKLQKKLNPKKEEDKSSGKDSMYNGAAGKKEEGRHRVKRQDETPPTQRRYI